MTDHFCVISQEMPDELKNNLQQSFTEVIALPPDKDLAAPVRCHPDMIFAELDGHLFVSARYYEEHPAVIERIAVLGGMEIHPFTLLRNEIYPNDVAFNAAVFHRTLICRPDATCTALLDYAGSHGYRILAVKQGYTGCSCILTDGAVLTSDRGIAKTLQRENLPCILLPEGGISLPGYPCGFPGGAAGYHAGVIYICGNAEMLPCAPVLREHGYRLQSLSDTPVTDYGGIKIFKRI